MASAIACFVVSLFLCSGFKLDKTWKTDDDG